MTNSQDYPKTYIITYSQINALNMLEGVNGCARTYSSIEEYIDACNDAKERIIKALTD